MITSLRVWGGDLKNLKKGVEGLSFLCLEIILQSYRQLPDAGDSSRRLVHPAADDDFVKLLYSLQNCVMYLKKKIFLPL